MPDLASKQLNTSRHGFAYKLLASQPSSTVHSGVGICCNLHPFTHDTNPPTKHTSDGEKLTMALPITIFLLIRPWCFGGVKQ
ncbi:unnamed protein product [Periconia digitata]|uniref:Uncharacterized protein n=1 Tax=Periconia digitata TaxID=1303443 RepID=A0A9W4UWT3_9PLEO|nr:unnamed protein product [Periconia digitata]